jgi:hypothetical protein
MFEPNVFKLVIYKNLIGSIFLPFYSSMLKSSPIFRRNATHLVEKKMFEKNKDYPFCKFECFEHAIFFMRVKL